MPRFPVKSHLGIFKARIKCLPVQKNPITNQCMKTKVGQSTCSQQGDSERLMKVIGSLRVKADIV